MSFSFDRKCLVALMVAAVVVVTLWVLGVQSTTRLREMLASVSTTHEAQEVLADVESTVLEMQSSAWLYVLTGQQEPLARFRAGAAQLPLLFEKAKGLVDSQAGLPALQAEAMTRRDQLSELVNHAQVDRVAASERLRADTAQPGTARIRTLMEQMDATEHAQLAQRQQAAEDIIERNQRLSMLLVGTCAVLLIGIYIVMRAELHSRQRAEAAERQTQADLEARVAERSQAVQEATAALALSEARLRMIFETASEAILTIDERQIIVMANAAAAHIFGYAPRQLLGLPLAGLIPPGYREQHRHDIACFGRTAKGHRTMGRKAEVHGVRADGSEFPAEAAISHASMDGVHLYTVVVRDITRRRHMEAELARSHRDLQRLVASQHETLEVERRRIARELHDELQQTLAAIKIDLAAAVAQAEMRPGGIAALANARNLADQAIEATRRIIADLRPQILDDLGLVPALQLLATQFEQRTAIACTLDADEDALEGLLSVQVATALFRIVQEALNNAARHSQAERVEIQLSPQPQAIILRIADDGIGLAKGAAPRRGAVGMIGMQERARLLSGTLEALPAEPHGTVIQVRVPVPQS